MLRICLLLVVMYLLGVFVGWNAHGQHCEAPAPRLVSDILIPVVVHRDDGMIILHATETPFQPFEAYAEKYK